MKRTKRLKFVLNGANEPRVTVTKFWNQRKQIYETMIVYVK